MKNLLNYGVQEMNTEEKVNVVGGYTRTRYRTVGGVTYQIVDYFNAGDEGNGIGPYQTYYYVNGRRINKPNGLGINGGASSL